MKLLSLCTLLCFGIFMNTAEAVTPKTLHDFTVKTIEGHDVPLKTFKNKVLLVVNVASKCGLTPQYADLEKLYKKYRAKGFEILAFPANNFGGQEPGTNEEIQNFCSTKYEVTFPIFSKISVLGADKHELYTFLTSDGQEISWNFEKFLIGKNGAILKRYSPRTAPTDEEIIRDIEAALK